MAAPMMACRYIGNVFLKFKYTRVSSIRLLSTEAKFDEKEIEYEEKLEYPPVKPQFPPGMWQGQFEGWAAWKIHEQGETWNKIPKVKERLERIAGRESYIMHVLKGSDLTPDTLLYKQHATKTHIIDGLPESHNALDVSDEADVVRNKIMDTIVSTNEQNQAYQNRKELTVDLVKSHKMYGNLISAISSSLSLKYDHLLYAQLDENVRMKTFWQRYGYVDKDGKQLRIKGNWHGILTFQYQENAHWQIRTELPLPEFLSREDEVCKGGSVECPYSPTMFGQNRVRNRRTNISGHWIGDPCEWSQISFYSPDNIYKKFVKEFGEDMMRDSLKQMVMSTGFGACAAQAYNQGFTYINDITYPITTHTVAFDAIGNFYICAYQLNTLELFKNDDLNPYRNLAWISGPHRLYDKVEDGQVKGFNDNTLELLLKCVLTRPVDRGVDLRPYLPKEESPLNKKQYINMKGEPPFEHPKIRRYQYPRNAVYF